ncbi:MAG: hypothetical protein V9G10_15900 [Candidatus Nanopelagicales bacterium]
MPWPLGSTHHAAVVDRFLALGFVGVVVAGHPQQFAVQLGVGVFGGIGDGLGFQLFA